MLMSVLSVYLHKKWRTCTYIVEVYLSVFCCYYFDCLSNVMLLLINYIAVATTDCLESMFGCVGFSSISYLLSAVKKGLN